jgi:hypothetical protein
MIVYGVWFESFSEIAARSLERTMFVIFQISIHYMRQFKSFVSSYF